MMEQPFPVVGGPCDLCHMVILSRDDAIIWTGRCNQIHYFHRKCLKRLAMDIS